MPRRAVPPRWGVTGRRWTLPLAVTRRFLVPLGAAPIFLERLSGRPGPVPGARIRIGPFIAHPRSVPVNHVPRVMDKETKTLALIAVDIRHSEQFTPTGCSAGRMTDRLCDNRRPARQAPYYRGRFAPPYGPASRPRRMSLWAVLWVPRRARRPRAGRIRVVTADHYFTAEPSSGTETHLVEFTVAGRRYQLTAAGGVFSAGRLDPGTAVLLRKAPLPPADATGPLLDLGCGYGPITCVLAAMAPRATIYAVDVNTRALALARQNAEALGAGEWVQPLPPEAVPDDVRFAQIWSNPPIRVGKAELHEMLRRWLPRLAPDGMAWLVVAKHLGGDSLQRWLTESGWPAERHASQKGYRVLRVAASTSST